MSTDRSIDATDLRILNILQENARTSNAEIARRVGMAPSAISERIRKLEEGGILRGYAALVDPRRVGQALLAFVFVRTDDRPGEEESTGERLARIPEVQEVHHVAGEDCFLVKVRTHDPPALGRLLRETLGAVPTIRSTRSTIVLESIKDSPTFALESPEEGEA